MIQQRINSRLQARAQFEAAAFDTQQGGIQYGVSNIDLFEPIQDSVVLVGDTSSFIFKLWCAGEVAGEEKKEERKRKNLKRQLKKHKKNQNKKKQRKKNQQTRRLLRVLSLLFMQSC